VVEGVPVREGGQRGFQLEREFKKAMKFKLILKKTGFRKSKQDREN
jgi:hypothetical protein